MRKAFLVLCALPALGLAPTVRAEEPAAAALSFNVGAVSDYRYRGISQSRLAPALQAGADFGAASGPYLGTWASTIHWIRDAGTMAGTDAGGADLEWDVYGGYKGELVAGLAYDVGALAYIYPGNHLASTGAANANTAEVYGALTFGAATLKYSHAVTNLFGVPVSTGSGYVDLSGNLDLGHGWSCTAHVGAQSVRHASAASYVDASLAFSRDLAPGLSLSVSLVGTDADRHVYTTPAGRNTGRGSVVLGVKYTL